MCRNVGRGSDIGLRLSLFLFASEKHAKTALFDNFPTAPMIPVGKTIFVRLAQFFRKNNEVFMAIRKITRRIAF